LTELSRQVHGRLTQAGSDDANVIRGSEASFVRRTARPDLPIIRQAMQIRLAADAAQAFASAEQRGIKPGGPNMRRNLAQRRRGMSSGEEGRNAVG